MFSKKYKERIADSKHRLDAEMRAYMRQVCHHPLADCILIVSQRCHASIDPAYAEAIWLEFRAEEKRKYPAANFRS